MASTISYIVYSRFRPFWIYTTVSFFKKKFPSLPVCVLKILSILKKKKKKKKKVQLLVSQIDKSSNSV